MILLKQSTVTIIQVGPVLGTDFVTPNTAIALATTRAELFQAGATVAIDISARTWTHIAGGVYQLTLTAGDLALAGPLLIHIHLATATPLIVRGNVLTAASYGALFLGTNIPADIQAVFASSNAAVQLANGANATITATVGNGSTTTIVATNLTNAITGFYVGRTAVFLAGTLIGQAASITGYNGTTKQLTVSALTGAPNAGDTFIIV